MSDPANGASTASNGATGAAPGAAAEVVEAIREGLRAVLDPELGINIVDLGLVYDIAFDDGTATVTYTLTTMGCPVGPLIDQQMQQVLATIPGVEAVNSQVTFSPPWTPERMSEEAKAALGMF